MTLLLPVAADGGSDETLETDARPPLGSNEMIDQRLRERLGGTPLPGSQVNATFHGRPPHAAEGRGGTSD